MIDVRPAPHMRRAVEDALRTRLSALGAAEPPDHPAAAAPDPEESLRRLMVAHRPNIGRKRTIADEARLLGDIVAVAAQADWNDLRFIDALNAVHEAWDEAHMPRARAAFVRTYARALERMLASR
jgi:hypothetical protein